MVDSGTRSGSESKEQIMDAAILILGVLLIAVGCWGLWDSFQGDV